MCTAIATVSLPFLPGLSATRIFYIRDLSLYFWGRHLWLRRSLADGEWPLWDPFVGGGQAAAADALHQMFLLPVLAIRMLGNEVLGFNLWIMLPFPLAAAGAWLMLRGRFSAPAAALGAIAFALSGPVASTGNFPNMSWSVAAMPWTLWAVDRMLAAPTLRACVLTASVLAFQALSGEPVTLFATSMLALGYSAVVSGPALGATARGRTRGIAWTLGALALGASLASVQLVPMVHASGAAERSQVISRDMWSLHPVALVETIAFQFFGNYFTAQSLDEVPWLPIVNVGREGFFFSLYFGVPLLALSLFGLIAVGRRPYGMFWAGSAGVMLLLAFGVHTRLYPFLRDHLPVLGSFRFPVKYFVGVSLAVAVGAAAGWDALGQLRRSEGGEPILRRARVDAIALALLVATGACALALVARQFPEATASRAVLLGKAIIGAEIPDAGQFMVEALPRLSLTVLPFALAGAGLLFTAGRASRFTRPVTVLLFALVTGDLVVRASDVNPVFDAKHVAEPAWLAWTRKDPNARFYVGGKREGTLDPWDLDSPLAFFNPPGLVGSASRAAVSAQAAFYPSPWKGREMLSYDLAVLWPRIYELTTTRFFESNREDRDRFLDRTGVRYRALPERLAGGRQPLAPIPYFPSTYLYDWGPDVAPRADIVPVGQVVADPMRQIDALFAPDWDVRQIVLVDRAVDPAGAAGEAAHDAAASARIVVDRANYMSVEAQVPAQGGYLVVLDSYSADWVVRVDGRPATLLRANGLFRAVRLAPGSHVVEFSYRPRALLWGAAVSAGGVLFCGVAALRRRHPVLTR